jgi:hypothetical protein
MVRRVAAVVALVVFAGGCATYRMKVETQLSRDGASVIESAESVHVVKALHPADESIENEIAGKLYILLDESGLREAAEGSSDLLVHFSYNVDSGTVIVEERPGAPVTASGSAFSSGPSGYSYGSYDSPSAETYVPYSRTVYTRTLSLRAFSRGDGAADEEAWVARVTSSGAGRDPRTPIDYMLLAAFEYFGKDASAPVTVVIQSTDPRLKTLRAAGNGR